jgi:hypothetical protein
MIQGNSANDVASIFPHHIAEVEFAGSLADAQLEGDPLVESPMQPRGIPAAHAV